ncbi:MAG: hypothetical protein ACUVSX_15925 [Aggregatilineales bacterium]
MRSIRGLLILAVIVGALVALLNAARQRLETPWGSGSVVVQPQYRLDAALDESLAVLGETIALGPQSAVEGQTALVGDSIYLAGAVNGDLTVLGSTVIFASEAVINGDALLLADNIALDGQISGRVYARASELAIRPTAVILGPLYACGSVTDARVGAASHLPCDAGALNARPVWGGGPQAAFSALGLLVSLFAALLLSGLAALIVTLFPRRVSCMAEAMQRRPGGLGRLGLALGLLSLGLGALYLVLLAALPPLGLLLLPAALAAALALLGLAASGWIALALLVGDFLLRGLARTNFPPLVSAAAGSAALAIAWNGLLLVPPGGWAALAMLAVLHAVGLGTAAATRLGTRPLHDSYLIQG